jgi:hypothetical protein
MRPVQRGITTSFIVFVILAGTIALTNVYLSYFQAQNQKTSEINSFEDCAKLYPVMESYPEQCNTPDGKNFVRQLNKEIQTEVKASPKSVAYSEDLEDGWKLYRSSSLGIEFEYPAEGSVSEVNKIIQIKVPLNPRGQVVYSSMDIEKNLTQKAEDILCFDLNAEPDPNGNFKYKKCEHGEDRVEEKIIAGKKAKSFGYGNAQYYQIEDPVVEIRDYGLVNRSLYETGQRILNSMKFL